MMKILNSIYNYFFKPTNRSRLSSTDFKTNQTAERLSSQPQDQPPPIQSHNFSLPRTNESIFKRIWNAVVSFFGSGRSTPSEVSQEEFINQEPKTPTYTSFLATYAPSSTDSSQEVKSVLNPPTPSS
ncbi:MAG: hypothetical protein JSS09_05395, partial [Verrucomicrobia bacterium]|nr:hypothetical protein [Verrucomicrobiota bacterium]